MCSRSPMRDEEELGLDEQTPLLRENTPIQGHGHGEGEASEGEASDRKEVSTALARRLYLSHFLSTWNSRAFEFGAVLYLATIYPGTLLPMSIYAFTRGLSAILLAPSVGHCIDAGNRMQVVRASIVGQRIAVAISCVAFYLLSARTPLGDDSKDGLLLAFVAFLACIEKLCSILNLVSVEKDWVVVVADGDQATLTTLNAQMRRIDLICKLLGPLFIALVDGYSTQVAILVNLSMNVASVIVEYFAIAQVYYRVPGLQEPKTKPKQSGPDAQPPPVEYESRISHNWKHVEEIFKRTAIDFKLYFEHDAFLPSFAGALLYLTVLSFGSQMVTYLLAAGYDSTQIGVARTLSVVLEILATWVAPWLISKIGPVRAGLWMSSCQVAMLTAGTVVFWVFENDPLLSSSGVVGGTILSRLGLRGFDLCAQIIVQNEVEAEVRGAFSSVEAGWQNGFELLSYASTMIFSRPDHFKWPALISVVAVALASVIYTFYVYMERKHLIHLNWVSGWSTAKGKNGRVKRMDDNCPGSADSSSR